MAVSIETRSKLTCASGVSRVDLIDGFGNLIKSITVEGIAKIEVNSASDAPDSMTGTAPSDALRRELYPNSFIAQI